MTNEEAINNLDAIGNILGDWFPGETSEPFKESLRLGMEALEKQTPKKLDYGQSPNCGVYFGRGELFGNWCQYCGQRLDIDWSEAKE